MPIELSCPSCGKQLRLADEHAGKAGRCPACQATFQIPTHSEQQTPAPPFGSSPPLPPNPAGNLFPQQTPQQPPNPFASTSSTQSPYGGTNPYNSPQAPNMYGAQSQPGEGMAIATIVLGIISIVFAFFPCCCYLNLLIGVPCGVVGLILSFQVPKERRMVGMILNGIGLGLIVLFFAAYLIFIFVAAANQGGPGPDFDF